MKKARTSATCLLSRQSYVFRTNRFEKEQQVREPSITAYSKRTGVQDENRQFPAGCPLVRALQEDFQAQYPQFHLRCDQPLQPAVQGLLLLIPTSTRPHRRGDGQSAMGRPSSSGKRTAASTWPSSSAASPPSAWTASRPSTSACPPSAPPTARSRVPRDRFPNMMVGISLWGDEGMKLAARQRYLAVSSRNYAGDPTPIISTPSPRNRWAASNAWSEKDTRRRV